jgi:hypothetical protein
MRQTCGNDHALKSRLDAHCVTPSAAPARRNRHIWWRTDDASWLPQRGCGPSLRWRRRHRARETWATHPPISRCRAYQHQSEIHRIASVMVRTIDDERAVGWRSRIDFSARAAKHHDCPDGQNPRKQREDKTEGGKRKPGYLGPAQLPADYESDENIDQRPDGRRKLEHDNASFHLRFPVHTVLEAGSGGWKADKFARTERSPCRTRQSLGRSEQK